MDVDAQTSLFVVLGNQLFPFEHVEPYRDCRFYMAEDVGLCTYVRHHKQKIALFLAAMRSYADHLRDLDCDVAYARLDDEPAGDDRSYEDRLGAWLQGEGAGVERIVSWEIVDHFFAERIARFCEERSLEHVVLPSPMFLTPRDEMVGWLEQHSARMAEFYRWQRRRLGVLLDDDGEPTGGRWSFDEDNRERLPKSQAIPEPPSSNPTEHVEAVVPLVEARFADHPGELSLDGWWLPTTRRQALGWVRGFLEERFELFGPYEDALSTRGLALFHSVLTPALNLGLITPKEILDRALEHAEAHDIRINSLEGLVRQIIGWREFIRGIHLVHAEEQKEANFFGHERSLTDDWYAGTTGIVPLDDVIRKAQRYGWAHHIERLMIAGNLMVVCEIEPRQAWRWFMELFVDSADWVMGPNVYGMGIFSDGGIFATKPYICGSNYVLKMSDYAKPKREPLFEDGDEDGPTWCDVMDGLYWRFIDRNREFFRGQARMAQAVASLDRMADDRRERIFDAAERFLDEKTG